MTIAPLILITASLLSPAQKQTLARDIVCPANLPSDAARIAAMKRFINRYALYAPGSTINERLAFRDAVLAKKKCTPPDHELNYSFPQS